MAERRIRARRTRSAAETQESNTHELLKSISLAKLQVAKLQDQIAKDELALFAAMKRKRVQSFGEPYAKAEIVTPEGRVTNVIDPAGFRKLVTNDKLFFSAISISVTAARKLVPERALKTITTTLPGKTGEPHLKVTLSKDAEQLLEDE